LIDWVILLAPLLLAPITLLLVFLGCATVAGLGGQYTAEVLSLTVNDTTSGSGATVSYSGSGSPVTGTINANGTADLLSIVVTTNSVPSSLDVNIDYSISPSGPWTTILSVPFTSTNGGTNGPPAATIQQIQQMVASQGISPGTSFYLQADNGTKTTGFIQVNTPLPPPPSGYNWNGTACVPSTSGAGQYPTLADCQAANPTPPSGYNWNGTACVPSTSGAGQYPTLADCQAANPTPITRVQPVSVANPIRGTNNGATITVTFPSMPTNGNNLYAVIANQGSNIKVNSISQTGANWTPFPVKTAVSNNGQAEVEIWKAENISAASQTVTITLSGTPMYGAVADLLEYSGLATNGASSTDQTASANGASSAASTGMPATATNAANELWLAAVCSFQTATSQATVLNGFTLIDGTASNSQAICSVLEKIVSTTGTASSGVTCNPNWWAGCIATFKGA